MDNTPVLHLWRVQYLAQTTFKPSRIRVTSIRNGDKFIKSYDSDYGDTQDQAAHWLRKAGWTVQAFADSEKSGEYFVLTKEMKL